MAAPSLRTDCAVSDFVPAESRFRYLNTHETAQPPPSIPLAGACILTNHGCTPRIAARAQERLRKFDTRSPRFHSVGTSGSGVDVQRRYCEEGLKLDTDYFEKTRIWITAEADKRVALGANRGLDAGEWNRIARRASEAKGGHEEALREYMEHVILCPVCHAHLASAAEQLAQPVR